MALPRYATPYYARAIKLVTEELARKPGQTVTDLERYVLSRDRSIFMQVPNALAIMRRRCMARSEPIIGSAYTGKGTKIRMNRWFLVDAG